MIDIYLKYDAEGSGARLKLRGYKNCFCHLTLNFGPVIDSNGT